jgi:hypothetical protein
MSSAIMATRARILEALEAGGVRSATGGKYAAPCVLVEPGDPWSEPRRLPGRVTRWRLTAIAGRVDTEGAYEQLGEFVELVDVALLTVAGVQLPAWAMPHDYRLGDVTYAATIATVQLASS